MVLEDDHIQGSQFLHRKEDPSFYQKTLTLRGIGLFTFDDFVQINVHDINNYQSVHSTVTVLSHLTAC